jgi:ABC-type nickel/cobalt efflux system permease component RcnA
LDVGRVGPIAVLGAVGLLLLAPAVVSAHPLGNFTINHYAGIRVRPYRIDLDVVIDEAEIPTFSERQRIDTDGSGTISDAETEAERQIQCGRLATSLDLEVDGAKLPLVVEAAGLSFPPGAAGLATMRVVCEYSATPAAPIAAGTTIHFADPSNAQHLGWHEIVVTPDGVALSAKGFPTTSVSKRLTDYPAALIPKPLDVPAATFAASPGGASLATACVPDAYPLVAPFWTETPFGCAAIDVTRDDEIAAAAAGTVVAPNARTSATTVDAPSTTTIAAVPGGVGSDISGLLETRDLTPPILLLSLLTAALLGAAHALTPGHGKTVMAAYLVGTRGTTRQALGLGLTVTASHTMGVFALAIVILAFNVIAPESYEHVAGIVAGLIVVSIGGWLVVGQVAARRRAADPKGPAIHSHGGLAHSHGPAMHEHGDQHELVEAHEADHVGAADGPVSRRSLFALGLFGGLVPSVNALIILLAALTTGRAAYGFVLVVAFGVGMAVVLSGIGLGLVHAGRWMGRRPSSSVPARVFRLAPAVTAVVIVLVGLYVTGQAILGSPTL